MKKLIIFFLVIAAFIWATNKVYDMVNEPDRHASVNPFSN